MHDSVTADTWSELFGSALESGLSPEQACRLRSALRKSRELRERWFEFVDLECGLQEMLGGYQALPDWDAPHALWKTRKPAPAHRG